MWRFLPSRHGFQSYTPMEKGKSLLSDSFGLLNDQSLSIMLIPFGSNSIFKWKFFQTQIAPLHVKYNVQDWKPFDIQEHLVLTFV